MKFVISAAFQPLENLVALAMLQEGNALLGQLTESSALIART